MRNLEAQLALPDSLLMQGKVTSKATNIRNGAAIEHFGVRRTLTEVDFDDLKEALAEALKDKEELTTKLTELTKLAACSENDRALSPAVTSATSAAPAIPLGIPGNTQQEGSGHALGVGGWGPGLARRRGEEDSDCVSALSPISPNLNFSSHESPRPATPPSPPALEGSPSFLGEAAKALARVQREEGVEALAREMEEASLEVAEDKARVAEENAGAQFTCSTGVQKFSLCWHKSTNSDAVGEQASIRTLRTSSRASISTTTMIVPRDEAVLL